MYLRFAIVLHHRLTILSCVSSLFFVSSQPFSFQIIPFRFNAFLSLQVQPFVSFSGVSSPSVHIWSLACLARNSCSSVASRDFRFKSILSFPVKRLSCVSILSMYFKLSVTGVPFGLKSKKLPAIAVKSVNIDLVYRVLPDGK